MVANIVCVVVAGRENKLRIKVALCLGRKLEALLGYQFRDRSLLKEACTHSSWKESNSPCYQRLEFLGDAVLDLMVTETLAKRYP